MAIMNEKGLKRKTIEEMLTTQIQVPVFGPGNFRLHDQVAWGLGVGLQETDKGNEFWHWGDNGSFKCYFTASRSRISGMVYFTNSSNGLSITTDLVDLYLGTDQPAWAWNGYSHTSAPIFQLARAVDNGVFKEEVVPYLMENGTHLDTTRIGEREMNRLGYILLGQKRFVEAKEAFYFNVMTFPKSSNVYDSYAEACLVSGDQEGAVKYYTIAAEMNPENKTAQRVVEQIEDPLTGNAFFRLPSYSNAHFVTVAGDFNGWNQFEGIMRWQDGAWTCSLNLEPGAYEYKFVVDDIWILDPANPESTHNGRRHVSVVKIE